jgi:hypothetical protein
MIIIHSLFKGQAFDQVNLLQIRKLPKSHGSSATTARYQLQLSVALKAKSGLAERKWVLFELDYPENHSFPHKEGPIKSGFWTGVPAFKIIQILGLLFATQVLKSA